MGSLESWTARLARKASLLVVDENIPDSDPVQTWFGRVTLGEPGEQWPCCGDRLMWPLLQIVVAELPYRPTVLDDIALIRVYVNPAYLAKSNNGGADYYHPEGVDSPGWLLRASPKLDNLNPIIEPAHGGRIKPAPGQWKLVEADYPTNDDLPANVPESLRDAYCESDLETQQGTKVGGWPFNVQSEIFWGPHNVHPHNPEYVFQIDSDYERGWMWGDSGLGYFGCGTGQHRDKWAMEWQCY